MANNKVELINTNKGEVVEIKELFSQFKGQLQELLDKKKDTETKLQDVKNKLSANQEDAFKKLHELEEMIENGVRMNNLRLKYEKDLDETKDKITKLTRINSELSEVWK